MHKMIIVTLDPILDKKNKNKNKTLTISKNNMITFKKDGTVVQESETLSEDFLKFVANTARQTRDSFKFSSEFSSELVVVFSNECSSSDVVKLASFLNHVGQHSHVKISFNNTFCDLVDWIADYLKKIIDDAISEKKWDFVYVQSEHMWDISYAVDNIRFVVHISLCVRQMAVSMKIAKVRRGFNMIPFRPILQTKRLYQFKDDIELTLKNLIKVSHFIADAQDFKS